MEEFQITLTKAEIWGILGAIELCYNEGICFVDRKFKSELNEHLDWETLEKKLKPLLYGD